MKNHIGRSPFDVAISREHFETAILILTAGGKANKDEPLKEILRNQADDPVLNELQELILRDKPAGELF